MMRVTIIMSFCQSLISSTSLAVPFTDSQTCLIITQENKKSRILSFDSKKWRDFVVKIRKVKDQLKD